MNIFEEALEMQTAHDNPVTQELAKKQLTINEKVREMSSIFHEVQKDKSDKEPDWAGMLLQAKDATQKMRIRAAREAYQEEQKVKAFETAQAAFDERVNRLLTTPQLQRNKFWYEELQKTDPNAYWDSRVQKQKQRDRETLKLGFHLKAR